MNRETHILELPSGRRAELYKWLTAREGAAIREIPLKHSKIGTSSDVGPGGAIVQRPQLREMDTAGMSREMNELLVKTLVVSIDGSQENIYEQIMDGPDGDYLILLGEARKISGLDENFTKEK